MSNKHLIYILLLFLSFSLCFIYYFILFKNSSTEALKLEYVFGKLNTKLNACIIVLVNNRLSKRFVNSFDAFEQNFNSKFNYDYLFFTEEKLDEQFITNITKKTKSKIEIVQILPEHWSVPSWLDQSKVNQSVKNIGFSISYRHMCRFFSGLFYTYPQTKKYEYFMRIDTDSLFTCEIEEDPFLYMKNNNKKYGFILLTPEGYFTIPSLWSTVKSWNYFQNFTQLNPKELSYIADDKGEKLNSKLCMVYNNFEIASFSLFRDKIYQDYFDHLDRSGGFYYERWVKNLKFLKFFSLMSLSILANNIRGNSNVMNLGSDTYNLKTCTLSLEYNFKIDF